MKNLPDIALLAMAQTIDTKRLRAALDQTFTFRKTHGGPGRTSPVLAWTTPYALMSRDIQLAWRTLDAVSQAAGAFLDPVLARSIGATWDPTAWTWRPDAR